MGIDGDLYQFVKVLHILAVIIGFGGTFIAAFYGAESTKRPGAECLVIAESTLKVTGLVPTMAVYSVPILGILLILLSDDLFKFSEPWISLAFLLYIALIILDVVVQVPAIRKMIAVQAGGGSGSFDEMRRLNKTVATAGGIVNLLWIAILFLMVFKPGQ